MSVIPTRERIVATADRLFYEQGFEPTSFADIAQAVHISRGNFYHHFKTKDEILQAVIQRRLAHTQAMLEHWQLDSADPVQRVRSFIHILLANQAQILAHGCPVGGLSTELAKLAHPAHADAVHLFTLFRAWLREQFRQMGHDDAADTLAMHLLARSQGIATLAQAFDDPTFIHAEVRTLHHWLAGLIASTRSAQAPP